MAVGMGAQSLDGNQRTKERHLPAMADLRDMESVPASATCRFVGEGRANLVFTLTGVDGHPSFKGMLLEPVHHGAGAFLY